MRAAALDKTPKWKSFLKITLPMISPTIFFLALMNIIAALKVFETVNIMTKGGPMKLDQHAGLQHLPVRLPVL